MDYSKDIEKIKNYIDSSLEDELNPEKIACEAGYSVFHFCRIFKEYTGKTLMGYVREKRLDAAKNDIINGRPFEEILEKYGFETQSGFARAYERKFGMRPKQKINV